MQANSPGAYFISAILHAFAVAVILVDRIFGAAAGREGAEDFRIGRRGRGQLHGNGRAGAGHPGGVKFTAPELPAMRNQPEPEPVPVQAAPEPVIETCAAHPGPKAAPVKAAAGGCDSRFFEGREAHRYQSVRTTWSDRTRSCAKLKSAKPRPRAERQMTKEEFDKQNKNKRRRRSPARPPPRSPRSTPKGIAKGVVGGSTANKTGGAGGKALTREEGDALDLLFLTV